MLKFVVRRDPKGKLRQKHGADMLQNASPSSFLYLQGRVRSCFVASKSVLIALQAVKQTVFDISKQDETVVNL